MNPTKTSLESSKIPPAPPKLPQEPLETPPRASLRQPSYIFQLLENGGGPEIQPLEKKTWLPWALLGPLWELPRSPQRLSNSLRSPLRISQSVPKAAVTYTFQLLENRGSWNPAAGKKNWIALGPAMPSLESSKIPQRLPNSLRSPLNPPPSSVPKAAQLYLTAAGKWGGPEIQLLKKNLVILGPARPFLGISKIPQRFSSSLRSPLKQIPNRP